jgi:MFS family permease
MSESSVIVSEAAKPLRPSTWRMLQELGRGFWIFFGLAFFFNLGLTIFFFLYNLYLLDLGYNERFLGLVVGVFAIGSMAGALPAGVLAQRLGLRKTLLLCLTLAAAASALRAAVSSQFALLTFAFVAGIALAMWAVCLSPAVAQLTNERSRPLGFSITFSTGIGIGILGGVLGGHLPGWLASHSLSNSPHSKQAALLVSTAVTALALIPALFLHFPSAFANTRRVIPRSPFLIRFLIVMGIWTLVTGAFSPFFNAYATQGVHFSVEHVGTIFSVSQMTQVVTVLASPIIFRKLGFVTSIGYMQFAAAVCFAWLALDVHGASLLLSYSCLVGFQWMCEPGMYSLLMSRVSTAEQSGASALNALVISASQALAGTLAGAA